MTAKSCVYDSNEYVEHTFTQIPLKISLGLTVWKAQGSTFKGKNELI